MITRLSASIIGLLAFAGCILIGMLTGNTFETIILRALGAMAGGMVVGWLAGFVGQVIVQENFRQTVQADTEREMADRAAADQAVRDAAEAAAAQAAGAGDAESADVVDEYVDVSKDDLGESRLKDDTTPERQTVAARAARELLTGVE